MRGLCNCVPNVNLTFHEKFTLSARNVSRKQHLSFGGHMCLALSSTLPIGSSVDYNNSVAVYLVTVWIGTLRMIPSFQQFTQFICTFKYLALTGHSRELKFFGGTCRYCSCQFVNPRVNMPMIRELNWVGGGDILRKCHKSNRDGLLCCGDIMDVGTCNSSHEITQINLMIYLYVVVLL